MNARPEYQVPTTVSPATQALLAEAAKRKTVWIRKGGKPAWLNHKTAVRIHAKYGGQIFPPEGGAA